MKTKVLLTLFIFLVQPALAIPGKAFYSEPNSITKIEMAQNSGDINAATSLLYKVMALTKRGDMPQQFQSETPIFCGTELMDELAQSWPVISPQLKKDITGYMPKAALLDFEKVNQSFISAYTNIFPSLDKTMKSKPKGNNFVIHYTLKGANAVSGEKYVKKIAKTLERAHKKLKIMYGKTAKNKEPMPVFLIDCKGYYGACTYINASGIPPTAESYIELKCNLDKLTYTGYKKYGEHLVAAVPCHEYFHAVQNNFDATEGIFMKESSADWIEGVLYRSNKIYVTYDLPLVYNKPHWPLWHDGGYRGTLFQRFCQENFKSTSMNAAMWDKCAEVAGDNGVAAVGSVLVDKGSDWAKAIRQYGANNYFTRYWDYKKMKNFWPTMPNQGEYNAYGVEPRLKDTLYEMGAHYFVFNPPVIADELKKGTELLVKFQPVTGKTSATLLMETKKRNFEMFDIPMDSTDASGYYEYMAEGFGGKYSKAVLMVQSRGSTGSDLSTKSFMYAAASPKISLNSFVSSPASIGPGQVSKITLTFDVNGCWNTMDYPLRFKAHIKGPGKVTDDVTDLVVKVRNGDNQTTDLYFNSSYGSNYRPGTYQLGVQFVFGTSKKMTSKTEIEWATLVLKEVEDLNINSANNSSVNDSEELSSLTLE